MVTSGMLAVMPRIGIDCRFGEVRAGLGTYTRELVSALLPLLEGHEIVLFVRTEPSWLPSPLPGNVRTIIADYAPYSMGEHVEFPNVIQSEGIDLFYAPHFNVPYLLSIPFVCTVHDLILHDFPGNAGLVKRLAYQAVLRRAVKKSRAIVTISRYTKADIRKRYGESAAEKTIVAYPGVSNDFSPRSPEEQERIKVKYGLSSPYLLYVGGCKEHKNVQMLIDAFHDAGLGQVDLVLVANGRECAHLKLGEHVRFLSDVRDEDLPALYSAARGSVTATLAEGFYLPGIEAMACECPVMATNIGPLPEVLGENALLVEPDRSSLADGVRRLILASGKKDVREWTKKYSWERGAETIVKVLDL